MIRDTVLSLSFLSLLVSCASNEPASRQAKEIFSPTYPLPKVLGRTEGLIEEDTIAFVPSRVLKLRSIIRDLTTLRRGPGGQYELRDNVLKKGSIVLEIERSKTWVKVYALTSGTSGWLHRKTTGPSGPISNAVSIKINHLPKVFSKSNKARFKPFKGGRWRQVTLPKGTPFYTLHRNRDKMLVLIGKTKSIAWIRGKDAI